MSASSDAIQAAIDDIDAILTSGQTPVGEIIYQPDWSADGESVNWSAYRANLLEQRKKLAEQLAQEESFEEESFVY